MGPRARARGNIYDEFLESLNERASMGPRARARGNTQLGRLAGRVRRASMGPRARARGNTAANIQGINENALQWGHERALVEIPLTTEEKAEVLELQCGHERALVEIGIAGRPRICPRRFNGATS